MSNQWTAKEKEMMAEHEITKCAKMHAKHKEEKMLAAYDAIKVLSEEDRRKVYKAAALRRKLRAPDVRKSDYPAEMIINNHVTRYKENLTQSMMTTYRATKTLPVKETI